MPTTVQQLFNYFDIKNFQQVKWGRTFNEKNQGVYIVSTSENPKENFGICDLPNFEDEQINHWINKVSRFHVDNEPATLTNVKNRLKDFWLPDENILYIGKAPNRKLGSGVSKRVNEYFRTKIGNGSPHSGGQWIKTLKDLYTFTVYYGLCDKPDEIENKMLEFFMHNVSKKSKEKLYDRNMPIPFANIKFKGNKTHGLKNQRL